MFSQKKIRYGDELTFDYCSFTESEKEYQNSICLCGTSLCRGYYLSCNRKHFHIFSDAKNLLLDNSDKCFLLWNAILLKSCVSTFDKFKAAKLMKYSIGQNIFKNSPSFLKTWAYFVLEQVLKEREALYKFYFLDERDNVIEKCLVDLKDIEKDRKYQIENLFEQRLQNLIISLDKSINFLDRQKNSHEIMNPLVIMKDCEILEYSIDILEIVLKKEKINDDQLKLRILEFVKNQIISEEETKLIPNFDEHSVILRKLIFCKLLILQLSEYFQKNAWSHKSHIGLSDILYFHSMTKVNFTTNQFSGFDIEINVRDCDLTNPHKLLNLNPNDILTQQIETKQVIYTMKKKIAASYLWGQLVFWNKQTIEKPEASLSAGRRGILTYPEISQSFLKDRRNKIDKFPNGSRKKWLENIRDKPGDYWPIGDGWSYENKNKIFGTFLLDDFFLETHNRNVILDNINNDLVAKEKIFNNVWKNYC